MTNRTARTHWTGSLNDGSGDVELTSSRAATHPVSFPKRVAETADGITSPEELIGAAHSSCFAMQFAALLEQAGGTVKALDVKADVTLGSDPAGGFRLTQIALTVTGEVTGIDAETFTTTAEEAKQTCPVSKALATVPMTLTARLGA